MNKERIAALSRVRRVVIKVGSSLLAGPKASGIHAKFILGLSRQIRDLSQKGLQCLVVTSGAIAFGLQEMGWDKRPKEIPKLQALAAVGQSNLMRAYETAFSRHRVKVAQVLLTQDDLSNRQRYSNAHNTLEELFKNGIVPVVNENDTVVVQEIKFGDNDTLASLVAHLVEADLLILLTDTEGLYRADPRVVPDAELVRDVFKWDPAFEQGAGRPGSTVGTGGMVTKVRAAKRMMQSGVPMAIAPGRTVDVLLRLFRGEQIGTFFHSGERHMKSRKRWLAWGVRVRGEIRVDEGARKALVERNTSLLPGGVRRVEGHWSSGDVVKIVDMEGREIARGMANLSSQELDRIKGLRTSEAVKVLGYSVPEEVVHRDDLVRVEEP
jgi:glutamate 5-kinase